MTKNEFEILNYFLKNKYTNIRDISEKTSLSLGLISKLINAFNAKKILVNNRITKKGLDLLKPYKVKNAIIMAAGMSSRFVPLSLERPKGLLEVKGEVLIERQINQLHEAGIKDITIVLGYKKEMFFYLKDKYKDIKLIINLNFNTKNNIETLFLAKEKLDNTYICSSDNYFAKNPFESYVYESYYSAIKVDEPTNEWYMIPDKKGYVKKVTKTGNVGTVMLGHVYWNKQFSSSFKKLIIKHHEIGDYDQYLWEQLYSDNIKKLPKLFINVYPDNVIFEFDSLEELKAFDKEYIHNPKSTILNNICKTLKCKITDIKDFKIIKDGLTNSSFHFEVKKERYVYRHPGEGTEAIISRAHENKALEIAKKIGADPTFVFMNPKEGWKISKYVKDFRIPDYSSFNDSKKILNVLRKLHQSNLHVSWGFKPWEDALEIEKLINKKSPINMKGFYELKNNIGKIYKKTINDGVKKRFCHCDTYKPNWLLTKKEAILIDWEYAGEADPGCDLGCYIMDSMWEVNDAIKFIKEYCQKTFNKKLEFHYLAYVALVSYYWFVWALYREACGAVMGESLYNWHVMAKRYSDYLVKNLNK